MCYAYGVYVCAGPTVLPKMILLIFGSLNRYFDILFDIFHLAFVISHVSNTETR